MDKVIPILPCPDIKRQVAFYQQLGQPVDDRELKALLEVHKDSGDDWEKVKKRYFAILEEE